MTVRVLVLIVIGMIIGWFFLPARSVPGGDLVLIPGAVALVCIGIGLRIAGKRLRSRAKSKAESDEAAS